MKKLLATLLIAGSTLGLAACETSGFGDVDTAPPYADERTVTYSNNTAAPAAVVKKKAPARAERVFRSVQSK